MAAQNHQSSVLEFPYPDPPAAGTALQVATDIYWIRLPLPMALDHVNCYALANEDGWTLVDTGVSSKKTQAIWRDLLSGPLQQLPVKRVLVTHHHPDHVGLAGWFQQTFGAELIMTRTAWLMARMLYLDAQERPPAETILFWKRAGMDPDILAERVAGKPFNFVDAVHHMPLGYRRIKQGDCLKLAGRAWDVHIGNGHAPEHATLWSHDQKIVIAGDQIISSISPNLGVYATEPDADPVGDWIESCTRLAPLARGTHLVLSGHKLPFRGLPHRLTQLVDNHHNALDRLLADLDTPKSATQVFSCLYHRKISHGEYGLALVEAVAHLNHLYQSGRVRRFVDQDEAYRYVAI